MDERWIIDLEERVLVTGASGFLGARVVRAMLDYGFRNIRCFVRPSTKMTRLQKAILEASNHRTTDVFTGNLFSMEDCKRAVQDVSVIYHLAVGPSGKSFPSAFLNTVVPTRNLLDASVRQGSIKRFVNISSFAVYSNRNKPIRTLLDESCPIEKHPERRADAYAFAKLKQDDIVIECAKEHGLGYVILRPGVVYGPGKDSITGRVGIDTFGKFLHLGGENKVPFTYVDNCADAILLAGVVRGADGEVFNVVDDDLPTSRQFLRSFKENVKRFSSVYVPHAVSYALCYLWEKYSDLSEGQLPLVFSRSKWHAYWKRTNYTNQKLKSKLGWSPRVPTGEALRRYFESCRGRKTHA